MTIYYIVRNGEIANCEISEKAAKDTVAAYRERDIAADSPIADYAILETTSVLILNRRNEWKTTEA